MKILRFILYYWIAILAGLLLTGILHDSGIDINLMRLL